MELFGRLPLEEFEILGTSTHDLMLENRNTNFVVIGASGFLGRWLSTFLAYARINREFMGTLSLLVRDRDKLSEFERMPQSPRQRIIEISNLGPESFRHLSANRIVVFFAATSTSKATLNKGNTNIEALRLAKKVVSLLPKGDITFIHMSSGGVYKFSARQLNGIPGDYGVLKNSDNAYVTEKIALETWSKNQGSLGEFTAVNPRLFSFYGPGLQLDRHFAIGEFMEKAQKGMTIEVKGNPKNLRSYLYPTDTIWQLLLQCKLEGSLHTQIGSSRSITIEDAGKSLANLFGIKFRTLESGYREIDNYVPLDVPNVAEKDFNQGLLQWSEWLGKSRTDDIFN
jgi:nucleoside-diphosphate-sugar epimerase